MSKKTKNTLIKIVVSTGLFTYLYFTTDKEKFVSSLSSFDYKFIPVIILFLILNYVVSSFRWKTLILNENSKNVSVGYLTSLYFVGSFFNNFMPTSIGGDVYKIFKLGQKIENNADAFSATFMERFTGVIALVLISYCGLLMDLNTWLNLLPASITSNRGMVLFLEFMVFVGFWIALVVGFMSMKFLSSKISIVEKVYSSLIKYKNEKKVVLNAFLTSFIVQLLAIFTQYFIFVALGQQISLTAVLLVFPIITLLSFFIPSLNGLGVQDTLYRDVIPLVATVTAPIAAAASILYHLSRLSVSLIGGVLYALDKDK